jgi:acyl phosphate:glycerol-3-phosphate acyltransferase
VQQEVGGDRWWIPYAAGLAAMVGHAWPVFAGFRGGRCVLTFLGAWVVINPVELLVSLGVCLALYAVLRRFPLAARVGVFSLPVVQAFADPRSHVAMTGVLMSLIGLRFWQAHRAGHGSHT